MEPVKLKKRQDMKHSEKEYRITYRNLNVILMAMVMLLMLLGCKAKERIITVETVRTDTVIQTKTVHDSIFVHDSTYQHEWMKNDTVYIWREKWHTRLRDRLLTDTLYISKTDSIPAPYPVEVEVEKPLNMFQHWLMGSGVLLWVLIVGVAVVWFVRKKLPF